MAGEGNRKSRNPKAAGIVWFRADLRLADNPALRAAAALRGPVVPVFLWAPEEEGRWAPGSGSRWWLHQSLLSLDRSLRKKGSRLIIQRGPTKEVLRRLLAQTGAKAVFWNRRYEPNVYERDERVKSWLQSEGYDVHTFNSALLVEPWEIATKGGNPFRVFTPFWRACLSMDPPLEPEPEPDRLPRPAQWPESLALQNLDLEPQIESVSGFRGTWAPGEAGAGDRLTGFVEGILHGYCEGRDRPDRDGTSRLSPHLHFGEISPRQVWHAAQTGAVTAQADGVVRGWESFLRQLYWREFAYHMIFHEPHTTDSPLRAEFAAFPWMEDNEALHAWQTGTTGFPYIDAGMRQLWTTGWMHNRVRMAVASFLVKDLLLPWQEGAKWFWNRLVDADLANNTLGWQWTAGCGADAAPHFRIFNPVTQGERFDPRGDYVRRWVPEVARLSDKCVHRPWEAPEEMRTQAGIVLGRDYPVPLVDHSQARIRALTAYEMLRTS